MTPTEQIKAALDMAECLLCDNDAASKRLKKALALLESHAVVPDEPTEAMIKVAYSKKYTAWHSGHTNCEIYKAMIQAAKEGA